MIPYLFDGQNNNYNYKKYFTSFAQNPSSGKRIDSDRDHIYLTLHAVAIK